MAPHTQIIDLYGLPGCGKTTLMNGLMESGLECCHMTDVTTAFRHEPFWRKLRYVKLSQLASIVGLWTRLPKQEYRYWNVYKGFLLLQTACNYCRAYHKADYLILDHGMAQSVLSLMYGSASPMSVSQLRAVQKVMQRSGIGFFAGCIISPQTALERIRYRNRTTRGRFDSVRDDAMLLKLLQYESLLVDQLKTCCDGVSGSASFKLDMNESPQVVVDQLIGRLSKK